MTEAADNNVPEVMKPDALEYQLSILKHELETIAEIIGRIDRITQTMKNWSIVT